MINPLFDINVYRPNYYGMIHYFGSSKDYRFNSETRWICKNCEIISGLECVKPIGDDSAKDMGNLTVTWMKNGETNANDSWVERKPDFIQPVQSYMFSDGTVHSTAEDRTDYNAGLRTVNASSWSGNYSLSFKRMLPPKDQAVETVITVSTPDVRWTGTEWVAGRISLCIPSGKRTDNGDYTQRGAFIHHIDEADIVGTVFDVWTDGYIIDFLDDDTEGKSREHWTFEHIEDSTKFQGSYIIVGSSKYTETKGNITGIAKSSKKVVYDKNIIVCNGDYWDDENITPENELNKQWTVAVQGSIITVNVTPITYSYVGTVELFYGLPWRSTEHILDAGRWTYLASNKTGWTITATNATGWEFDIKPVASITPAASYDYFPVLWFISEINNSTIDNAVTSLLFTTVGYTTTSNFTYTWNKNWKKNSGTITWGAVANSVENPIPTPFDGGRIHAFVGWDDSAPATFQRNPSTANIFGWTAPDCTKRARNGAIQDIAKLDLSLEFGGFDYAKLTDKKSDIIDVKQAGGLTIAQWATMIGTRLSIPSARIYVLPAIQSNVITLNPIPSKPYLEATDGQSWEQHIDAIEKAMNIRVCWDKTQAYTMWVDDGIPVWDDLTMDIDDISLIIDETSILEWNVILNSSSTFASKDFKNFLKGQYGRHEDLIDFYIIDDYDTRKAADAALDDFQRFISNKDALPEFIEYQYNLENRSLLNYGLTLNLTMQMNPSLRPDMFVWIQELSSMTTDTFSIPGIFQIRQHSIDCDSNNFEATSKLELKYVAPSTSLEEE